MTGRAHSALHAAKPYLIAIIVVFGAAGIESGVDLTLKLLGLSR